METIKYNKNFYTNSTSAKDIETVKKYIEIFVKNMPLELQKITNNYEINDIPELEWQAVILGDYESRNFSIRSAGVFMINSHFIAYTQDRNAFFNQTGMKSFGYSTYGNNISIKLIENENRILLTTEEKKYIAVNSRTIRADYQFIKDLIEDNTKKNKECSSEVSQIIDINRNKPIIDANQNKQIIDANQNNLIMDKEKEKEQKNKLKNVDPRFKTKNYIISNNPIPKGFIFLKPVAYAAIKHYSLSNLTSPGKGYLTAYETCIGSIEQSIDSGEVDAVFNLRYSVHNIEGNYEVVMFGDGVIIENTAEEILND